MSIIIGADFVPTNTNETLFRSGDARALVGSGIVEALKKSSFRIVNLEMPLTESGRPIVKCGPNLKGSPETIHLYDQLSIDLVTLANNHIMDYGEEGLANTLRVLQAHGIQSVGAGQDLKTAKEPFCTIIDDRKVAVYACAEHEFSIADEKSAGVNPHDPLDSFDDVQRLAQENDYVIVLYHGGKECYRYPSPELQRSCRKYIEKGADIVICQHSHCIGCEEKYLQGTIVYGQGNFLFDDVDDECWRTGLLISIEDGNVTYLPIVKHEHGVRLADQKEREEILTAFQRRSEEISQKGFIREQYERFAKEYAELYFRTFLGLGSGHYIYRALNKILRHRLDKRIAQKYSQENLAALYNYIICEAHRELLTECVGQALESREKKRST